MQKKADLEREDENKEIRKKQRFVAMNVKSKYLKADSMLKMANGQNFRSYSDIAKEVYSLGWKSPPHTI